MKDTPFQALAEAWIVSGTSTRKAVAELEALIGADPELAHARADDVLLRMVPTEVRDAYARLVDNCAWWGT